MRPNPGARFVLTGDVDWASDYCVESYASAMAERGIVPTLFVTHASKTLKRLSDLGKIELGIHPNFLSGTTHGSTIDEILDHVIAIVPNPVALRCHAFFDNSHIALAAARRGVRLDSNICCHLQEQLPVLKHWNGVLRLPVFFEDDVHWLKGLDWTFENYESAFASGGLKILNFHPFMWTLNAPSGEFYAAHKAHITTLDEAQAAKMRYPGQGSASFLNDIIDWVEKTGGQFVPFSDLRGTLGLGAFDACI